MWRDEGWVRGRWGTRGAGILFVAPGPMFLLLQRSADVTEPGTWGIPGGAIPVDAWTGVYMDPLAAALKETFEEVGLVPELDVLEEWSDGSPAYPYTTYLARSEAFRPRLDWESSAWGWFTPAEVVRLRLHPGVQRTWRQRVHPWLGGCRD